MFKNNWYLFVVDWTNTHLAMLSGVNLETGLTSYMRII